jgi:hypothetical protein
MIELDDWFAAHNAKHSGQVSQGRCLMGVPWFKTGAWVSAADTMGGADGDDAPRREQEMGKLKLP